MINTLVIFSQIGFNSESHFSEIGIELILIVSFFIFTFIKIKKSPESERQSVFFLDESMYFLREEIRPQLLKFEWMPVLNQKTGEKVEEIDIIKHLNKLTKETVNTFVVIAGEGGCGKTKTLYEFARVTKKNRCLFARWNLPNIHSKQITAEYKKLPKSIKYILLDDVCRNPKKAVQFCLKLMPVKEKFILAVRDGDELLDILKEFHLKAEYFKLTEMENIADLLEFSTEPWINSDIKQKLMHIANGNPEVLSIGHEFIDQQSQDNLRFDASEFLHAIETRQGLFEAINNYFLENLGRAALAVISRAVIFNGLNRNDPFCKTNFKSYTKLRSLNYFYIQNDTLFFKPNILGEYITREYYFFKNKISPAFSNLLEDASEEDFLCVLSTLITFYKQQKLPVYKEAATYLLSTAKKKGLSSNTILHIILRCDEEIKDAKIIFDAIENLHTLNIETAEDDLVNRFAIFCADNKVYDCAAKWWEKLLEMARLKNNDAWITALYNNLGLVYFNLKDFDESLEWYRLAHDKFEALRNSPGIIQSLNSLAEIYQKKKDWQHSIELYKKSIDELKKIEDTKRAARTYAIIAQIYKSNNDLDNAYENYSQAMAWYKKTDGIVGLAQAYGNLGIISNAQNELDKAIEYFQKTLDCMEKTENRQGIARTHNNLALVYQKQGKVEKAVNHFQLAIEKFKFINDNKSLAQTYNNLALIYQKNDRFEEAREFHQRALTEFEKLDNNKAISQTLNNLGLVYQATEEWEQAIDCFQKSIKYKNIVGDLNGVEQVYGNLGITWQSLKKYDEAVKTYQLALDRMDRNGDLAGMAQTYSNLGVIYFDLKNYKEALKLLNQTLFFFMKQESTEDIKNVSNILSNIQNEMDKKKFSEIADAALNSVAKNGIRWRTQTALSADDAQEILKRLQKRKKKRMALQDRLPEVKKIELENSLRGDAQGHSK